MTSTSAGRKRVNAKTYTADDQALGQIAREAEAKLAAKRAARNEAREIRMRELEKQQKENEEKQDRIYELTNDIPKTSARPFAGGSSRRGSVDSTTDEGSREMRSQVAELDEKYKKAMMGTAQLHNEKQSLVYEVEILKDQLEEREEEVIESQREFRDKCKELESKKRSYRDLETDFKNLKMQIEQRDKLNEENGLAIIISDEGEWTLVKASAPNGPLTAGLPTMGMVNSRLASEVDTSLAQDEDFKQHKCIQTEPFRRAPIVGCRSKAVQTDEPDPATLRKLVKSVAIEIQTDDVPELLRAAIVHEEKITQTQSKPLELTKEQKYFQHIEYYRDVVVQTVESKYAPWTASHSIEEPPRRPPSPPPPRIPTPPPVVEIEPEEEELDKLREELNEDAVFDPSRFRKRMSLVGSGSSSKPAEKKTNKGVVDPKVGAKPTPSPPSAPEKNANKGDPKVEAKSTPSAPVDQTKDVLDSVTKSTTDVPAVQSEDSEFDAVFDFIIDEPAFDPTQYKKGPSASPKPETRPPPASASESKSTKSTKTTAVPEVQRQNSGFDLIFEIVEEEPVFGHSRKKKRPSASEVQRQESVGFDQIFDKVDEEPVFDPSRYMKRFSIEPQPEAQTPVSEPKPTVTQQSKTDQVKTPKPPTEVQRQESVGFDQIFEIVEDEPVFDPSRYKKRTSKTETPPPPASQPKPTVTPQSAPVETPKPPTEIQRQESVGFDQIFDIVEEEQVFDPSRFKKRLSALPKAEPPPPPVIESKPAVSQQPPPEVQESEGIFGNVEEEPVFDPSRYRRSMHQ